MNELSGMAHIIEIHLARGFVGRGQSLFYNEPGVPFMKKDLLKDLSDTDKRNIVKRMVSLRKNELNMTQPQLAKRLGYSQTYISLLERGERELSNDFLTAFLLEFSPSHQWMLYGHGDPFTSDADQPDLHISETMSALRGPFSLSDEDEQYLSWYLSLSPENRKKVILLKEAALSLPRMK